MRSPSAAFIAIGLSTSTCLPPTSAAAQDLDGVEAFDILSATGQVRSGEYKASQGRWHRRPLNRSSHSQSVWEWVDG